METIKKKLAYFWKCIMYVLDNWPVGRFEPFTDSYKNKKREAPPWSKKKRKENKNGSVKLNRLEERKKKIGSRKDRKLRKYSDNFNVMFDFFWKSYRHNILTFSGNEDFKVVFNVNSYDSKECFRRFDNGQYSIKHENGDKSLKPIKTRHNNILYCVIKGKKSWGLWVKEWSMGIAECNFTKEEILEEFTKHNIIIPKPLLKELDDNIKRMKQIRYARDYPML